MGRNPRADVPASAPLQVRLTPAESANLDLIAQRFGLDSRSAAVRFALELAARACWACAGTGLCADGNGECVQCEGTGLAPVERE